MLTEKQEFLNYIETMDLAELKELCYSQFLELNEFKLQKSANDKINTEMYLLYQKTLEEKTILEKELVNVKALLNNEIEKNDLNTKSTFGRKTESLLSLIEAADNKADEFEDEAQTEDNDETEMQQRSGLLSDAKNKSATSGKTKSQNNETKNRKSNSARLTKSMENLPHQITYDVDVAALDEKYGKGNWRIAFWHKHEKLEKLDTPYYVNVIMTPCISAGLEHTLETLSYENALIDRTVASPSIIADILYRKFLLALPFNRQAADYQMQGIDLSKQTIINWVAKVVPEVMNPVVEYLTECLMMYKYTQNDETYIQVNKDVSGTGHKSFLWIHASSDYLECNPIIIFCYERTRNTDHLRSFYSEFMGYITCDAYVSYKVLEEERGGDIIVTGCLMHCRRYFAEAFFINKISELSDQELMELPETKALLLIRDIYVEENKLKCMTAKERLILRQEKVSPLVDRFFEYVHELEQSCEVYSDRMRKAITYAVNQEKHLRIFLTDGNICCDNGNAERKIRSYSVGRANWLFADTVFGAEINATMYSIVETAKANKANVLIYLRYLLEEVPKRKNDADRTYLAMMTPWSEEYRAYERQHIEDNQKMCQTLFHNPEPPKTPKKKGVKADVVKRSA